MKMKNYAIFSKSTFLVALLTALGFNSYAQLPTLTACNGNPPTFPVQCNHASNWAYINGITTTNGINNISNTNTGCGNTSNSYSDYTGTSMKVTQDAGKSIDVKINWSGNSGNNIVTTLTKIYVDWNRDGDFDDQDEYISPGQFSGTHPHAHSSNGTITVDVPGHAKEGLTRMRILTSALNFIYDPNSTACSGTYGEAEDYVFEVINPCLPPNVISIANLDYKSGDFSWTEKANAEFYEYVITPADTIPDDTVIGFTFTTNNSVDVDTFQCDQKYYILVRLICDTFGKGRAVDWDKSAWVRDSFETQPCCYAPDLKFDQLTHSSARVSWDPIATSIGYEYAVSTLTTPPQKGTFTINNSVLLQGMSPKTTYFVHVRARCVPTPLSDWSQVAFKTLKGLSVDDVDPTAFNMDVFPNPVQDKFIVQLNSEIGNNANVTVMDLTGKVVYNAPVKSDRVEVNAAQLPSGVYIVKYTDDDHNQIMRVSKN